MTFANRWLGRQSYSQGHEQQMRAHGETVAGGAGVILGLEHEKTITLGCRGRADADLNATYEVLREFGWRIETVDRGGQATLHEPGQLVIYPILRWSDFGWGPREYVVALLETTARTLRSFGIAAQADEARGGVFTANGKIAFCGLRLQKGVSRHGLSVNVANPLRSFALIRPCGRALESLTGFEREAVAPAPLEDVFARWVEQFALVAHVTQSTDAARHNLRESPLSSNLAPISERSLGAVGSASP